MARYEVSARILGREPGDVPRILLAVEESSKEVCDSISRGPSWIVLGCNKGLVSAQVEAFMQRRAGGTAIECVVSISSEDPKWLVNVLERIRAEANSMGYPVLLYTGQREESRRLI